MDDMNAFEHQIASVVQQTTRSPRPVDVASIVRDVATQSPKWRFGSMFTATKFVIAGAIVALFGGFLLAGVLTERSDDRLPVVGASASATNQAEPTDAATSEPEPTTEAEADETNVVLDLLPGVDLVTEEVEPGVYRVLSDGVRDLPGVGGGRQSIAVGMWTGADGSVWRAQDGEVFEIGGEGVWQLPEQLMWAERDWDLAVDADGTTWIALNDLWSFDGETWQRDPSFGRDGRFIRAIELGPDGDLWAAWSPTPLYEAESRRVRVSRLTDDRWVDLPDALGFESSSPRTALMPYFAIDPHGEPWISGIRRGALEADRAYELPVEGLLHFDGWGWEFVDPVGSGPYEVWSSLVASGADGTLWATFRQADDDTGFLARLADGAWTVYSSADGVPDSMTRDPQEDSHEGAIQTASDGSVWMTVSSRTVQGDLGPFTPAGVARFDGASWQRYLSGQQALDLDVAPDGTAWILTADGTYAITPDTATAAEPLPAEPVEEAESTDEATNPTQSRGLVLGSGHEAPR